MEKQAHYMSQAEISIFPCSKPVYNVSMSSRADKTLDTLLQYPDQGLEMLVNQYTGYVYAIVKGKLGRFPRQDIEECVSDVFYTVYQNRDNIDGNKGTLKAYICTVAKSKAIDKLRQLSKLDLSKKEPINADDYIPRIPAKENVAQVVFDNESRQQLLDAISGLRATDAQILIRKYYIGQSNKEIAQALDMKENTVSKRGARALSKLAHILSREDFINE